MLAYALLAKFGSVAAVARDVVKPKCTEIIIDWTPVCVTEI